jgi:hypothetical protein
MGPGITPVLPGYIPAVALAKAVFQLYRNTMAPERHTSKRPDAR